MIMAEKPTYEELEKVEQKREQTELALQRRLAFEQLVKEISSEFAGIGDGSSIDSAIDRALSSVGTFTGTDRAYIFRFRNGDTRVDNTHEWCAESIEPQIGNLKDILIDEQLPWFSKQIRNHEVFHVPNVSTLPHDALLERKHFEEQNIQSLIVVPMEIKERLIGFLGFDAVTRRRTWPEDSPLRKPIKTIKESGMRAADVVADLLTIARGVERGKNPEHQHCCHTIFEISRIPKIA
jgi:transcriptional regulator with GAF, ATPase, and Fis domain